MKNTELKRLFEEFDSSYPEEAKNKLWENHSNLFKEFWNTKIMDGSIKELNDQEIDEIVMILDMHGKGNTPETESVAKVMIPQGAWRRLFNQLNEDNELSETINSIFNSNSGNERAKLIDRLYELNKPYKNNLTGKSGNAINTFLAAFNPFENLSIISLNDRAKLLKYLNIKYPNKSIGFQITETSEKIIEKFNKCGINRNIKTISSFIYCHQFVNNWRNATNTKEKSIPNEQIIERSITIHEDYIFYMESQLEDFIIENWDITELGQKYDLITDENGLASQQYRTDIGIIDILAKDKKDGRFVVIELKKNQSSDDTIGQLTRYMGWVEEHLSDGKTSKGIIIAGKFDKRLHYAMRKVPDIEVYLYKVDFQLTEYKQ